MVPGEVITRSGDVVLNDGSQAMSLEVANSGDRPIQVEPGQTREVTLVPIRGARKVFGFNGRVMGPL